jgi:cell division protein FtsB
MFGLTILDIMYIATTIMAGVMMVIYVEDASTQIDNSFIKLEEERNILKSNVQLLEKEVNDLKECQEEVESNFHPDGRPNSGEINRVLVSENRKLHVRCDMLEEELRKLREQNEIKNKYSFRLFSEKNSI